MIRFLARSLVLAGFAALSCATSTLTTGIAPITALSVDPSVFLQGTGVTCTGGDSGNTGAMRVYVATVYDVSPFPPNGTGIRRELATSPEECYPARRCFALPSSAPTSCFRPVLFQRIVAARQYVADVDGYDRTDITPLAPGSRTMVDSQGRVVTPRWKTSCGRSLGPPVGLKPTAAHDAGAPVAVADGGRTDGGHADSGAPLLADNYYDSGLPGQGWQWVGSCRERNYYDAAAWLDGPVCAFEFETETFKGCSALAESSAAGN